MSFTQNYGGTDFFVEVRPAWPHSRTYRFFGGPWHGKEVELSSDCSEFTLTHRETGHSGRYIVDLSTFACQWEAN